MRKPLQLTTALTIAMSLCGGCASTGFSGAGGPGATPCPPLKPYDRAFAAALADELAALPRDARVIVAITDYYVLRAQIRICRGETQGSVPAPAPF